MIIIIINVHINAVLYLGGKRVKAPTTCSHWMHVKCECWPLCALSSVACPLAIHQFVFAIAAGSIYNVDSRPSCSACVAVPCRVRERAHEFPGSRDVSLPPRLTPAPPPPPAVTIRVTTTTRTCRRARATTRHVTPRHATPAQHNHLLRKLGWRRRRPQCSRSRLADHPPVSRCFASSDQW